MRSEEEIRKNLDLLLAYSKLAQDELLRARSTEDAVKAHEKLMELTVRVEELQWVLL